MSEIHSPDKNFEVRKQTQLMGLLSADKPNWKKANERLRLYPHEARMWYVERKDTNGKIIRKFLPIHLAVLRPPNDVEGNPLKIKVPLRLLQRLYKEFPESLECADGEGMLPLHWALWSRAEIDIIEFLVTKYPHATRRKDRYGRLPLHIACEYGVSNGNVVQLLVKANPSSVKAQNNLGHTPSDLVNWKEDKNRADFELLNSLSKSQNMIKRNVTDPTVPELQSTFSALTEERSVRHNEQTLSTSRNVQDERFESSSSKKSTSYSQRQPVTSLREVSKVRKSSFSSRVSFDPSMNKVMEGMEEFLDKHRKNDYDDFNEIKSHNSKYTGTASVDDARTLLPSFTKEMGISHGTLSLNSVDEKVASDTSENKSTELALAIAEERWDDAILRLKHKVFRREAHESSGNYSHVSGKWLPIHEACLRKAPLDLIDQLCYAYPEGNHKIDSDGRLPMHIACESGCSVEVIKLLFSLYRDALGVRDNKGRTPKECIRKDNPLYHSVLSAIRTCEYELRNDKEEDIELEYGNIRKDTLKEPLLQTNRYRESKTPDGLTDDEGQVGTFTGKVVKTSDNYSVISGLPDDYGPLMDGETSTRENFINCCLCFALISLLIAAIVFSLVFDNDAADSADEPTAMETFESADFPNYNYATGVKIIDLDAVLNGPLNPFR